MDSTTLAAIGVGLGLLAGMLVARSGRHRSTPGADARVVDLTEQNAVLRERIATLTAQRAADQDQLARERAFLAEAEQSMLASFEASSNQALQTSTARFLDLARSSFEQQQRHAADGLDARQQAIEQLVTPLRESLASVDQQFRVIEAKRIATHQDLLTQVRSLEATAGNLASALRSPKARGRWGEMQLKRVVEASGMLEHCDFVQQSSHAGEAGRLQPDMVVQLPGGKSIVVDAKAPMDAYLLAVETADPTERAVHMAEHVQRIRAHVRELARKRYDEVVDGSPDFVVLFLPGEDLFSAALDQDPTLLEAGSASNVFIATPSSLIMMLRSALHGWREEALAANAREISELGKRLYERIGVLGEHWARVGRGLDNAVRSYNDAVSSLETRVLPTAREFRALDVTSTREIESAPRVEREARIMTAPELVGQEPDPVGLLR